MEKVIQKVMLDVGCSSNKQHGYVGMDRRNVEGVDIVHDAEVFPWPLDDESCAIVKMSHFIEHVKPWLSLDVINEAWRVLEEGGFLLVSTPYGGSHRYFMDPSHCNPWNEDTVRYFDKDEPLYNVYQVKPWKIEQCKWDIHGDLEFALRKINDSPQ
jgi:predicted SAM-dependent methyltransferase